MSTELLHFSLYAVLSYPKAIAGSSSSSSSSQQTTGPVTQPQTTPVLPASTPMATTTPPPTIATGDSGGGGAPIGAIAGGAVGGIVIIGIAAFAYNRYVRRQTSARVEPIRAIEGSGADDAAHPLLREGMFPSLSHTLYVNFAGSYDACCTYIICLKVSL